MGITHYFPYLKEPTQGVGQPWVILNGSDRKMRPLCRDPSGTADESTEELVYREEACCADELHAPFAGYGRLDDLFATQLAE